VRFTVLGQVELHAAGRRVDLGSPKQRAVIAALLLDANRAVPVETVIDRVWDEAPEHVRGVVHTYITRLRRVLAQAGGDGTPVLSYGAGSYRLEVAPDRVDLHRFRSLVDRGRRGDLADRPRAALLREALDLWRGPPLAGLRSEWAERVREDLKRQRVRVLLELAALELRLGRGPELVDELRATLVDNPLVEPLAAAVMRTLYQAGRAAEALQCYAEFRQRLREQLGTDPGAELRLAHEAILRDEVDQPSAVAVARPSPPVPAQLPAPVGGFTGRETELAQLDAMLPDNGTHLTTVVISAVWGTAGVGKTALALHWAHRVRDRFPDGQLYVNLCGFDPGDCQVEPVEVLRAFLEAFGVPQQRIPASLDAQAALYRSILADRRMLVVLDNARDAEQVRPLLPGAAGCLGLITSRNRLTSLVATEGAHPLALDLLTREESRELLIRRVGAVRAAAEPAAVEEIITACACLPLALAVVAARAATQPDLSLGVLARELRGPATELDALSAGDAVTDVRTVFSWSYAALTPPAARLFRLLGLHAGPDISAPAAASLAGLPVARARPLLDELCRAHLLTRTRPAGSPSMTCSVRTPPSRPPSTTTRPDGDARCAACSTTTSIPVVPPRSGCAHTTRSRCRRATPPSSSRTSPTSSTRWPGTGRSTRCSWPQSRWPSAATSTRTSACWRARWWRTSPGAGTGTTGCRSSMRRSTPRNAWTMSLRWPAPIATSPTPMTASGAKTTPTATTGWHWPCTRSSATARVRPTPGSASARC
jgi:DNA-binding SARP family transcriptional activator